MALCAVLALHGGVLWHLLDAPRKGATGDRFAPPQARIALRLIATPARVVDEAPVRVQRAKPLRPAARSGGTSAAPRGNGSAAVTSITTARQPDAAARADPAASAEAPAASLLDTDATRRAIRASAREPSLGDRLARARDEPDRVGAQERLAIGVKAAGKGDCLKGEYAGAGMGLLSLPFFAIAQARGDCAK